MNRFFTALTLALALVPLSSSAPAATPAAAPELIINPLGKTDMFPIAIWLQSTFNAPRYKAMGINLYVALWDGPTEAQLSDLERFRMPVICEQNAEGLKPRWNNVIVGWMHGDEPDNSQSLPDNKGYGPPILPDKIVEGYKAKKQTDPTRPILLNLGQGAAWDGWYGRGIRTNHPEDYPLYVQGADMVSFDIYPVVHDNAAVAGKLAYVGYGASRLVQWTGNKKPVWACIECAHVSNPTKKATPEQVRSEVFLALTNGARGIIYFAHQFAPNFVEAGVLQDAPMCKTIQALNAEIQGYAPILLSNDATPSAELKSPADKPPGALLPAISLRTAKKAGDDWTYVFTTSTTDAKTTATFRFPSLTTPVEVVNEKRTLTPKDNQWADDFTPYQVHIYRFQSPKP
jgi:hypothetical protein